MLTCPHCHRPNVARLDDGIFREEWRCQEPDCGTIFKRMTPRMRRGVSIGSLVLLAATLDQALFGGLIVGTICWLSALALVCAVVVSLAPPDNPLRKLLVRLVQRVLPAPTGGNYHE